MKAPNVLSTTLATLPDSVDIHVLLMAGLVAVTALGAALCVSLLLLMAPALHFALGRQKIGQDDHSERGDID